MVNLFVDQQSVLWGKLEKERWSDNSPNHNTILCTFISQNSQGMSFNFMCNWKQKQEELLELVKMLRKFFRNNYLQMITNSPFKIELSTTIITFKIFNFIVIVFTVALHVTPCDMLTTVSTKDPDKRDYSEEFLRIQQNLLFLSILLAIFRYISDGQVLPWLAVLLWLLRNWDWFAIIVRF